MSSEKPSHNCIKLSKYILGNGYDPETFYFNTHYKADKTNPLIGMSAPAGQLGAAFRPSPPRANAPSANSVKTSTGSVANTAMAQRNSSDAILESILGFIKKMSSDVEQLLASKKQEKPSMQKNPLTGSGLGEDSSDAGTSLPSLPFWDSLESLPSVGSSNGSSSYSFGSRLAGH